MEIRNKVNQNHFLEFFMFLNRETSHGHKMGVAYSGLQKSLRCGDVECSLYWAGQIGDSFPNALRKRLCQNSLEDAASWEYACKYQVHEF